MNVFRVTHSPDWFLVQSRSRPKTFHLVDIAYQDEPWVTPYAACGCEAFMINLHTMNKPCPHIKAVRKALRDEKHSHQNPGSP
jgi:predicted nucleic acid-binding Zn finger protein